MKFRHTTAKPFSLLGDIEVEADDIRECVHFAERPRTNQRIRFVKRHRPIPVVASLIGPATVTLERLVTEYEPADEEARAMWVELSL